MISVLVCIPSSRVVRLTCSRPATAISSSVATLSLIVSIRATRSRTVMDTSSSHQGDPDRSRGAVGGRQHPSFRPVEAPLADRVLDGERDLDLHHRRRRHQVVGAGTRLPAPPDTGAA